MVLALAGAYRRRPRVWHFHNACVAAMAAGQAVLWRCPLVALEEALRAAGGDEMWYSGSYVVFLVDRLTGFELPVAAVVAGSVTVGAATALAWLRWRRPSLPAVAPAG